MSSGRRRRRGARPVPAGDTTFPSVRLKVIAVSKRSPLGLAFLAEDRPVEALEQLDSAVRIVTLRRWYYLAALFLTLGAFGAFACAYQVPLKVDGRGIMLAKVSRDGNLLMQVTAPGAGRLKAVNVEIGSVVRVGDVLAEIDRDDLRDAIKAAEADLARLVHEDAELSRFDETEAGLKVEALAKVEETLRRNLQLDVSRLDSHRKIATADQGLNARRMLSDGDALKSRAAADAVESAIGSTRARLHELSFTRVEDQITRRREKLKRTLAIRDAETKRALLREQFERESKVVSPYAGKVVDLMLTPHAPIEKGTPAALLRPETDETPPMEAIVFVPAGQGKKIRVGDAVEVSLDTTRREEHGFIWGSVRSISEIPATERAMMAELKHKALVASFLEQQQDRVLLDIHVALRERRLPSPRGATVNHLVWSSTSGAAQRVSTGTLCSASIVVERRPLVALALPWLRHMTGMQ